MWKMCAEPPGKKPQKHVPIMIQAFDSLPVLAYDPPNVKMSRKVKFHLFYGRIKTAANLSLNRLCGKQAK